MSQHPEMVNGYLQYVKATVYDTVHLLALFDLKDTNQDVHHGRMTTVIMVEVFLFSIFF